MSDVEFDLSSSLKVKSNGAVGLPMYDFLLLSNSNGMCISHRLGVIATQKLIFFPISYNWTQILDMHLMWSNCP